MFDKSIDAKMTSWAEKLYSFIPVYLANGSVSFAGFSFLITLNNSDTWQFFSNSLVVASFLLFVSVPLFILTLGDILAVFPRERSFFYRFFASINVFLSSSVLVSLLFCVYYFFPHRFGISSLIPAFLQGLLVFVFIPFSRPYSLVNQHERRNDSSLSV